MEALNPNDDEDDELSALEQYLGHLRHLNRFTDVILSDHHGNTIFSVLDDPEEDDNREYTSLESNVVISGAKLFTSLDQLELGKPRYIQAQFHNAVVVQALDGIFMITVIGMRSKGHCSGSLICAVDLIRSSEVFRNALRDYEAYMQ